VDVLSAHNLVKCYGDCSVIEDVSLYLRQSEAVALLGASGAGKSTLFQLLIGVLQPDRGSIYLEDVDITDCPVYERARRGVSYLPQEPSVIRSLTVEQNLLFALEMREPDVVRRLIIVDELLNIFGITHVRATRAGRVSGGERRRCEIARTMASEPRFVLLDEPFAGLDPLAIADIGAAITLMSKHGVGVLVTDHNIRDTLSFVDRAYIIESGKILMEGTTKEIVSDPVVRQTYLGARLSL
jgi:lipopolysaccharide export system ATP-binding protein